MNKKAELFQAFLQERNIAVFEAQEIPNDSLNTVVFRSSIAVEGQQLPTLVILDSSIYGMIRVRVANAALKAENEASLEKALNAMNAKYKVFKYYFAEDGALILDACVLSRPDAVDCEMIFTTLDVIVKHLEENYKDVMKLIWA